MPYWAPARLPGSARPGSQSSLPRSRTESGEVGELPVSAYWATWVLPTSMTSGPPEPWMASVTFFPMPVHSWMVNSSSTPSCSCSYASVKRERKSSLTLSRISQMFTVFVPPSPPGSIPQPARASAVAAARGQARWRFFT
ncbi:hypothetical protein STANM309S_04090 [Streptomyces tanashiensis]